MKKRLQGLTAGLLIGFIVAGGISYAAYEYIAVTADFKVMVNGEEFVSDPPALVVEGRTYLPLRAIGDALGIPVSWSDELRQVDVGNVDETQALVNENEYSRNNPAPVNTIQSYTKSSEYIETDNYTVAIRVMETIRGDAAYEILKNENMFNSEPDDGYEYMNVKIAFSVISTKGDFAVEPNQYSFKSFSSKNEEVPSKFVVSAEPILSGQIYTGGNTEGWITIQVKKDDPAPKLAYGTDYHGSGGIWFNLQ